MYFYSLSLYVSFSPSFSPLLPRHPQSARKSVGGGEGGVRESKGRGRGERVRGGGKENGGESKGMT